MSVSSKLSIFKSSGTSMCFFVSPPLRTLSEFAINSIPRPSRYAWSSPDGRKSAWPGLREIIFKRIGAKIPISSGYSLWRLIINLKPGLFSDSFCAFVIACFMICLFLPPFIVIREWKKLFMPSGFGCLLRWLSSLSKIFRQIFSIRKMISEILRKPYRARKGVKAQIHSGLWFVSL